MRKVLLFLLVTLFTISSYAQDYDIRAVEVEVGAGFVSGLGKMDFVRLKPGAKFYGELRYNLKRKPVDVGLHISGCSFSREANSEFGRRNTMLVDIMAVSDYNFCRGENLSYFVGAGVGYAYVESGAKITNPDIAVMSVAGENNACFMPRIGIEFANHVRISFSFIFAERSSNHFAISIGGVFGGGLKKNRQDSRFDY